MHSKDQRHCCVCLFFSLKITNQEIQTIPQLFVLEKTIQFQSIQRHCVVKYLLAHDVVMCIMRKDSFLIGMLNKCVLVMPIPRWVPGVGPVVHKANGTKNHLMLTKTLEWTLNWCILKNMFDRFEPYPFDSRCLLQHKYSYASNKL